MKFSFYKQTDHMDCGPTCIRMIAKHYGRSISLKKLRFISETTREGASLKGIADAAEKIGFRTIGVKINLAKLREDAPMPCIIHWQQRHFVVLYKIKNDTFFIADPAHGLLEYNQKELLKNWIGSNSSENTEEGITLLLEPTPKLQQSEVDDVSSTSGGFSFLYQYLFQ